MPVNRYLQVFFYPKITSHATLKLGRASKDTAGIVKRALSKDNQKLDMPTKDEDYAKIPFLGRCPASLKMWVADEVA